MHKTKAKGTLRYSKSLKTSENAIWYLVYTYVIKAFYPPDKSKGNRLHASKKQPDKCT